MRSSKGEASFGSEALAGERLLSLGLPSSALSVAGFGAERPVADNDSPEGRARNRRIVLRLEPLGTD